MCEGQIALRRYKRLLDYGLPLDRAWLIARDGLIHCVWDHRICAWRDVASDTFWTHSEMLGWVQHAEDELEFLRAHGTTGILGHALRGEM